MRQLLELCSTHSRDDEGISLAYLMLMKAKDLPIDTEPTLDLLAELDDYMKGGKDQELGDTLDISTGSSEEKLPDSALPQPPTQPSRVSFVS